MVMTPSDLRSIPLFEDITDEHLGDLMGVFVRQTLPPGTVLFEAGAHPTHFILLISGEVALREGTETKFRLRSIAPIGELGSITGLKRNTTAVVTEEAEVLTVAVEKLMAFFEANGDVAFPFYHNLLRIVADKVRRDMRRLDEMRANIIRTQKAMKRLREQVWNTEETVLSQPVFETLEELIEHNRRWHYMSEPAHTLAAMVRLDGGQLVAVRELSDEFVVLDPFPGPPPIRQSHWSGVLVVSGREVPLSGTIESTSPARVVVQLDHLIESDATELGDYLTRLQMLDFVV